MNPTKKQLLDIKQALLDIQITLIAQEENNPDAIAFLNEEMVSEDVTFSDAQAGIALSLSVINHRLDWLAKRSTLNCNEG